MVVDHDDADDLVQETFLKVYKNIENFRESSQLNTWIYRIATNECLTFLNRKKRRFFLPFHDIKQELSQKLQSDNYINGDDVQRKFEQAVLILPDKQRLVFNMKYYEDMKYEDMAE